MTHAASPIAARALADPVAPHLDAVARLEHSRARLRRHLIALNGHQDSLSGLRPPAAWLSSLRSIPLVGTVLDTLSGWWSQHPLRVVVTLVAASAASAARPVTQRHPAWSLFGALAMGGLVMWARPWRFAPLRRAVYAGLLPQIASKVLSRLPTDGWMTLADSLLRRSPPTTTSVAPATVIHRSSPLGSDPART
ncbi:MAG: hypothetical protein ACKVOX_07895 [Rhizobacter sp.]